MLSSIDNATGKELFDREYPQYDWNLISQIQKDIWNSFAHDKSLGLTNENKPKTASATPRRSQHLRRS
jgi:hypothetical protein